MPKLANIYLIFDFFINNADFRVTRLRSFLYECEKKGALESENRYKLMNFCVYYIQRRLTFDYIARKFIVKDFYFKKNASLTLKIISIATGMCYFQANSEGVLSELKIMLRQYQNGAAASSIVLTLNNYLERTGFVPPDIRHKETDAAFSIRYSCPRSLVSHLIEETGVDNARIILENSIKQPDASFRLNCVKLYNQKLRDEFITAFGEKYLVDLKRIYSDMPFYSCDRPAFNFPLTELSEFKSGFLTPAGRSAFLAAYLLDTQPGDLVLDACASPGNKTSHVSELSSCAARIIAVDTTDAKVAKIEDNVERLMLNNVFTLCASSEYLDAYKISNKFNSLGKNDEIFDRILVDVPCSGIGLLRNRVELKYRFGVSDLTEMPPIQFSIINNAAKLLKKGGVLLYCTCTINKKENIELINEFLTQNNDFKPVSLKEKLKKFNYDFNVIDYGGQSIQILPDSAGCEGFFYALLKKSD